MILKDIDEVLPFTFCCVCWWNISHGTSRFANKKNKKDDEGGGWVWCFCVCLCDTTRPFILNNLLTNGCTCMLYLNCFYFEFSFDICSWGYFSIQQNYKGLLQLSLECTSQPQLLFEGTT